MGAPSSSARCRNSPVNYRFKFGALLQFEPSKQGPHVAVHIWSKEIVMFALTEFSRPTQRFVCMAMATVIVAMSLSLGALAAQSATDLGYSVTIKQIQ